jgi:tRNA-splicing ligase RtcB
MSKPIAIYAPTDSLRDEGAVHQMYNCLEVDEGVAGVLSADHHLGYSMPIGGTIAYKDAISPSGVGFDIGCGNMAVKTSIEVEHLPGDPGYSEYGCLSDYNQWLIEDMDEIARRISFGVGRPNNERLVTNPKVLDEIKTHSDRFIRDLYSKAATQLGTVGSGNHYVDLFIGDDGHIWVGVHFGSRGLGHTIATQFISDSGGMYAPPTLLSTETDEGQTYIDYMNLAGRYAYAGREEVVAKVLQILGNPKVLHTVHNHHNFAWLEEHNFGGVGGFGDADRKMEKVWVVRKGATPLFPGQQGFVGGSMGENAVIIEGKEDSGNLRGAVIQAAGDGALWSAPHGAGRQMSRSEAKGKQKKRWVYPDGHVQGFGEAAPSDADIKEHGLKKVWVTEKEGKIDWPSVQADLKAKGIEVRGGDADEAPGAYKRLPEVLEAHSSYVKVIHQLTPIGVAMAGAGTSDPYKD